MGGIKYLPLFQQRSLNTKADSIGVGNFGPNNDNKKLTM